MCKKPIYCVNELSECNKLMLITKYIISYVFVDENVFIKNMSMFYCYICDDVTIERENTRFATYMNNEYDIKANNIEI